MKNTFNTLYYTGLGVMVSISMVVGLFAMNLQNILKTFNKDQTKVEPYAKDASAYVIKGGNANNEVTTKQLQTKIEVPKTVIVKPTEPKIIPINDSQLAPFIMDTVSKAKSTISPDSAR